MKRLLICFTLTGYLAMFSWGILSHTLSLGQGCHPVMYFFVWDMFCGWSAHSERNHLIAEGESGQFYELAPGPWGDFHPYGDLGRHQYDTLLHGMPRAAHNSLRHTQHEPIARILLIQESWAKQYNIPDHLWKQRYSQPKDPHHYYRVRAVYSPEGEPLFAQSSWLSLQYTKGIASNPRLKQESRKGRPLFALNPGRFGGSDQPGIGLPPSATFSAPLAH